MPTSHEIMSKLESLESCLRENLQLVTSVSVKEFFTNDIDRPIQEIAKKVLCRPEYRFESNEEYQEYLNLNRISICAHQKIAKVIKQRYLEATPEDRNTVFDRTVHSYYHIYAENILHAYVRAFYLLTAEKCWDYSSAFLYDDFYQQTCIKPFFQCYGKNFLKDLETEKTLYRIRGDSGITCGGTYEDKDIRKAPRCKTPDGRVNLAGDPVLYLAESLKACVNEIFKDEAKKPSCILVGEFKPEKLLTLIDIEELIKARPDPARWIDRWLETDCSIQASSEAELCEMYMYIFMQEYNNLIHISASGAEEITYQRSTTDAKFIVDIYQQILKIEVHGLVWNSGRSAETTKSYVFFNGDVTEFRVDEPYIAKLSGIGNYEARQK